MASSEITLAIESAVAGGSLALFRGHGVIASRPGDTSTSRADTLLPQIAGLLGEAGVKHTSLHQIAVSLGPGSFTGIRIGLATALGLRAALRIPCKAISCLDAIVSGRERPCIAAVPAGKSDVAWRLLGTQYSQPVSDDESRFIDFLEKQDGTPIFLHASLIERLGAELEAHPVTNLGTDLASLIGLSILAGEGTDTLEPIYLRNSRYTGVG